ncbi:MAG: hypothetical protein RL215_262 [Planctomycetota bacterium]
MSVWGFQLWDAVNEVGIRGVSALVGEGDVLQEQAEGLLVGGAGQSGFDIEGEEGVVLWAEFHEVFERGDDCTGSEAICFALRGGEIFGCEMMMVGEPAGTGDLQAGFFAGGFKGRGVTDAAEEKHRLPMEIGEVFAESRLVSQAGGLEVDMQDSGVELWGDLQEVGFEFCELGLGNESAAGEQDGISAAEGINGFAQESAWEQEAEAEWAGDINENEVQIAVESSMLQAVIHDDDIGPLCRRELQEVACGGEPVWILDVWDFGNELFEDLFFVISLGTGSAIAAADQARPLSQLKELLAEEGGHRCFSGAAGGEVADADDWHIGFGDFEQSVVIECIAGADGGPVTQCSDSEEGTEHCSGPVSAAAADKVSKSLFVNGWHVELSGRERSRGGTTRWRHDPPPAGSGAGKNRSCVGRRGEDTQLPQMREVAALSTRCGLCAKIG